jgi:NAD(P)-dependent dehydrogenase (short-subunit alcohol dehydrogenase family)
MKRFDGQVAVVTGGARGIGAATARRLATEGAAVVLTDVLDEEGERLATEIRRAEGRVVFEHLDVSVEAEWRRVVDRAPTFGRMSVLVNNAGIARLEDVETESREAYDRLIAINQTGVWLGMKSCAAELKKYGGAIVNVSSIYGASGGTGGSIAYHASKGAVRAMTKSAAIHWAKDRIRVNSVHPGFVDTPMVAPFSAGESPEAKAMREYITTTTPMGRMARPEEIAAAIAVLASHDGGFTAW